MNKIAISLIALAALSTASFAEGRGHDLYASGAGYPTQQTVNSTSRNALAIVGKHTGALTAFELASQNAVENERDSH